MIVAALLSRSTFLAGLAATTPLIYTPTTICNAPDTENYRNSASYIRRSMSSYLDEDITLAGPLLRLAFHDATTFESSQDTTDPNGTTTKVVTGGPNGSIRYELEDRSENRALSRPLKVVEQVHSEMIEAYPCDVPSLADTIALAGAVAVEHSGGPHIPVRMGRPDAQESDPIKLRVPEIGETSRSRVENTMPSAALDSLGLRLYFSRLGLSEIEFVALSGSHGLGRHVSLLGMPKSCLKNLTRTCLEEAPVSLPFVYSSVDKFSNAYFKDLLRWNNREVQLGEVAFIPTDVAMVVDEGLKKYVIIFANDEKKFYRIFAGAYQKLVDTTATSSKRF